jgi:hypothetical protein
MLILSLELGLWSLGTQWFTHISSREAAEQEVPIGWMLKEIIYLGEKMLP